MLQNYGIIEQNKEVVIMYDEDWGENKLPNI